MTQWTDKHYDLNYTLTEKDIDAGSIRIDAYFVAKQWKTGSKDDSGALFHVLKTIARFGDKNDVEREVKALHAQVLGVARSFGVELEAPIPDKKIAYKMWCDTCEGVGHYDNTDLGLPREYRNTECPCPDCGGKGYSTELSNDIKVKTSDLSETTQTILGLKDTTLRFEEELWYPDDSGKWVETSSIPFEKARGVLGGKSMEMLASWERQDQRGYKSQVLKFEEWAEHLRSWSSLVAYKIVE